jgi:glutathione synthase/RimK-type ligase-like ATP-grasp enzyme
VLLATCEALPEGEPGHEVLEAALAARGIDAAWAVWDDPFVEWCAADLVAVRSTWDYDGRVREFLGWAGSVGPGLLHGAEVFRWNTDKSYLVDLARLSRVPVVPTVLADTPVALRGAAGRFGAAVVKPRVGAGGRGVVVVRDAETWLPADTGPWVVQPLLESVFDEGEVSVFVMGGHPVAQVRKVAGPHDVRVNPGHGGTVTAAELAHDTALLAVDAVAATTELVGYEIVYARVDLLRHLGAWCVSEVEVTEPGLYLDVVPGVADAYADALAVRWT